MTAKSLTCSSFSVAYVLSEPRNESMFRKKPSSLQSYNITKQQKEGKN